MDKWHYTLSLFLILSLSGCGKIYDTPNTAPDDPALITAAESGDIQSVKSILDKNQPVDVRDACQWTPLMKAALYGHQDVVKRLLEAGADVNLSDKGGYTPLLLAASNNHSETVEFLLNRGADINAVETTMGWTALIWAAKRGHQETVETLLSLGANTSIKDNKGKTAADWAREKELPAISRLLNQNKNRG